MRYVLATALLIPRVALANEGQKILGVNDVGQTRILLTTLMVLAALIAAHLGLRKQRYTRGGGVFRIMLSGLALCYAGWVWLLASLGGGAALYAQVGVLCAASLAMFVAVGRHVRRG